MMKPDGKSEKVLGGRIFIERRVRVREIERIERKRKREKGD